MYSQAKGKDRRIEELNGKIQEMMLQHKQELEEMQQKTQQQMHDQLQQQYASQLDTNKKNFETQITQLNEKIMNLTQNNQSLEEKSNQFESLQKKVLFFSLFL